MSQTSKRLLLGFALAGLILEGAINHPALATDKVTLFKVVTGRDEIIIGMSTEELLQLQDRSAGGVARQLVDKGSLTVWQYGVRKVEAGGFEQAPLHQVGLLSSDAVRVEPYTTPLKVIPIPAATGQ